MSNEALDERRKALEEQFFKKQNEQLVRRMKEAAKRQATKEDLKRMTGINNEQVLTALSEMNLGTAATLVLSMYPLVDVAWADGNISDHERRILLEQSQTIGIQPGSEASLFLAHWLDERPELTWQKTWVDYVAALSKVMKPEQRDALKGELLGRARLVAEASGGMLGFGFSVSAAERAALDRLEKAFS